MKFANIGGHRHEARRGTTASCPSCGSAVVAKCGDIRRPHWAHKGQRTCDPWWENETEWHRSWKNEFLPDWQEIVHTAENGERHVADVKTGIGTTIEFQHSPLNCEERTARETFYQKMVWVVDGARLKLATRQLLERIRLYVQGHPPFILYVADPDDCALLRDWNASLVPVYLDLGVSQEDGRPDFWRCDPIRRNGRIYLAPVPRETFLKVHHEGLDWEAQFSEGVRQIVEHLERAAKPRQPLLPPLGVWRYPTRRHRL